MVPEDQAGLLSSSQGWSWVGGGCCQEGRGPLFLARHLLGGRGPAAGPGHLTSIPPTPASASVASSAVMSTTIMASLLLFKHRKVDTVVGWGWGV